MGEVFGLRIRYAATAATELENILAYLREQSPQVVRRFRLCVRQAERRLRELPAIGQSASSEGSPIRRILLRPYPYLMFYQIADADILIVGLRHASRDPAGMPGAGASQ